MQRKCPIYERCPDLLRSPWFPVYVFGVVDDESLIEAATIAANNATYKQVLPDAESFSTSKVPQRRKIAETADEIAKPRFRRR